ncbi:hypothetical protein BDZ97DRAFT_1763330 [Flammula alnicola]|nr:hypothetical protein BDZ97DRAFT_1763330 [Flammula alnicola]
MAARPLQPSEYEIQREVEALRDLRRRSVTPGALTIDPDLPNQSPPSSPTTHWAGKPPISPISAADVGSVGSFAQGSSSSDRSHSAGSSRVADGPNNPSDDPLHLFWEHARSPVDGSDSSATSSSHSSLSSSSSLSRKRSMLSRQYRPKENDGVEDENIVPLKRNRSLLYPTNPGPQLTISDLQMLEELAEEASESDDPSNSKLRNVLRRSLSLNLSPSAVEMMDEVPDMGDEADAPIIVPPPGQILRRAARTKIRKPGLPGDGGGHRFGASRRGNAKASPAPAEPRTSSDFSSSDHGENESPALPLRRHTLSDEGSQAIPRPESYSEETSIYDAYARDEDEDAAFTPVLVTAAPSSPPPQEPLPLSIQEPPQIPMPDEVISPQPEKAAPVLHQPQPQRLAVPQPAQDQGPPSRTPSPSEPVIERPIPVQPPPSFLSITPSPPAPHRKEKGGKGLFKWGGDKGGKKGHKDKERENHERAEKEKESGFFGSLFGKKKQESEYQSSMTGGTSGREAAQALLGASKSSKSYVPPTSPGLAPGIGGNPYARYPIHVERAIYRLSHIKLANPRRPLYEQVLISNLMFWYLGVINKAQNPPSSPTAPTPNGAPNSSTEQDNEQEEREKAQREKEQKEKEQREKAEKERLEKEQREREIEMKKKESGRRGSLTKTPVGGPPGGRRAEMPIKGPQYEMQHRVMEQEYGGYNGQPPRSPTSPGPAVNGAPSQPYPRPPQPGPYNNAPPKLVPPQPKTQPEQYYYQPQNENPHQRPGLPPGAMPPAEQQAWGSQQASPPSQRRHPSPNPSHPGSHRRSHSPPSHNPHVQKQPMQMHKLNTSQENLGDRSGAHRGPGRSLSATAYTSPALPPANGVLRKGNSANAVAPYDKRPHTSEGRPLGNGEEEDVPLAVWQQQRRK